jgi:hypothetical protein
MPLSTITHNSELDTTAQSIMPSTKRVPRFAVKRFVQANLTAKSMTALPGDEIDRLFDVSLNQNLSFSKRSIQSAFYRARRQHFFKTSLSKGNRTEQQRSIVELLDETIAGLQLIRESLGSLESQYTSLSAVFGPRSASK